ncbi:MAG TPA: alpha/beta fold hydrolase [Actinomycetes bacterium]|nr:alpha/beta fold hydrolase [Actinomycetes bacterium]
MNAPHWPGAEWSLGDRALFVRTSSPAEGRQGAAPALMVHGLGGQATNWTDLMAELVDDVEAWAPDLPGFGWSPPPPDADYSLTADVEVLSAMLERLHAERGEPVHVFGNSMGGAIAVLLATARPDLVKTLTLISPAMPDLRPRRDTMGVPVVALPGIGRQLVDRMARVPAERQVQGMVALNYGDATAFTPTRRAEAVSEVQRRLALPHAGEALSGAARGLLRSFIDPGPSGLWASAGQISCPTLVIYGGRDRLVDHRRSRRAARHMPHAQVITLPRVGHVAQMEDPPLVARFVRPMMVASHSRAQ